MSEGPLEEKDERLFLAGLLCTTFSALLLEVLDTRLLSVLTWYHLSFFAVSLAMFGLAAGGLRVYLAGEKYSGPAVRRALVRAGLALAFSIPLTHVILIRTPLTLDLVSFRTTTVLAVALSAAVLLATPFFFAGIAVGLALTRMPVRIGVTYGVDLVGAALGCLAAIPLLKATDISTATFAAAAIAAIGAVCFQRMSGAPGPRRAWLVALALVLITAANVRGPLQIRLDYAKGQTIFRNRLVQEAWNGHSQVLAYRPRYGGAFYWGPGRGAVGLSAVTMRLIIDGSADTHLTRWDGKRESLDWTRHDVTSLPYHLRPGGDVGVIGVGGGRDILTALWAESRRVTGIEINDILIDLVARQAADLSRLGSAPGVRFVHDDARSFLTRTDERYDVLQMSLIDSWASTSAGAFTLSENGLYTREAWAVFLGTLKPEGLFSVSRWFSPDRLSETNRLLSLATAALLDRGIEDVSRHLVLVSRRSVATLVVSPRPFTRDELARIDALADDEEFRILVAPDRPPAEPVLGRIAASRSHSELQAAVADDLFDFSPPTDERPYFFNLIRPRALKDLTLHESAGVVEGNLLATTTLLLLVGVSTFLVAAVLFGPVWFLRRRTGASSIRNRPPLLFGAGLLYFSLIGSGYMLIQIPYLQRFSVYLGHPTYALVVILFSMILATGLGSLLSERLRFRSRLALAALPLTIAATVIAATLLLQPAIDATIRQTFERRALIVLAFTAPLSLLLGCCFPVGMRLASRGLASETPWMWAANGACSVLASSLAVALSMWAGIDTSLYAAAGCYATLAIPALILSALGDRGGRLPVLGLPTPPTTPGVCDG